MIDIDEKRNFHLRPIQLVGKEALMRDIELYMDASITGKWDAGMSNVFIQEVSFMIKNSLYLFEMGYFDCACYSLRQALEMSITMAYLYDQDESVRQKEWEKWRTDGRFPMYGEMIKKLESNGRNMADIKSKIPDFFDEIRETKDKLNKFAHKQGVEKLYACRSNLFISPDRAKLEDEWFSTEFTMCVEKCIGAVAVIRLAIDPMPVLLSDSDIYSRTGEKMTLPYSFKFIEKYIGAGVVERYKQTEMYEFHYQHFIKKEKMLDSVSLFKKHKYLDVSKASEISKQNHLLNRLEKIGLFAHLAIDSAIAFYGLDGMEMYLSNRFDTDDFKRYDTNEFRSFMEQGDRVNIPFQGAFISFFRHSCEDFWVEHRDRISFDDKEKIRAFIATTK